MRDVLMLDSPAVSVSRRWDARTRKRRLVWRNCIRNDIIAAVAMSCGENRPAGQVAVLVENTEHGRYLLDLLPDWAMLSAVPDAEPPLDPTPKGWIVTLMYAYRHGLPGDILVRATGGRGHLLLGGSRSSMPKVIIDVADKDDERARADTAARLSQYRAPGWRVRNQCELIPPAPDPRGPELEVEDRD